MSTPIASPSATERTAAQKAALAKPNGQSSGAPGQFAALLQLQADEEPTTTLAETEQETNELQADSEAEGENHRTKKPQASDAAQQALQALMDWRALASGEAAAPAGRRVVAPTKPDTPTTGEPNAKLWLGQELPARKVPIEGTDAPLALPQGPALDAGAPRSPIQAPAAAPLGHAAGLAVPPMGVVGQETSPRSFGKTDGVGTEPTALNTGGMPVDPASPTSPAAATARAKPTERAAPLTRATLDLVNRTETPMPSPLGTAEKTGALEPTAVSGAQGAAFPTGEGIHQPDLATHVAAAPTDGSTNTEAFASVFQQQMDEVGAQVSYWAAQGAQRASFTVGSDSDTALDVAITLSGGELTIAFETDEANVREVLQDSARDALQALLEPQGITLGEVSVSGGQAQHAAPDNGGRPTTLEWAQRGRGAAGAEQETAPPPLPRKPQIMTATQLDFYA